MSFDVYFQGFASGAASSSGGEQMMVALAPHIVGQDSSGCLQVKIGDDTADVYLNESGMMANHVGGRDPWDLLVSGARAAGWVIMPTGCPTFVTDAEQFAHLPEALQEGAVLVTTGAELLAVIEAA
ncbi:MAG: hypothetical protein LLG14_18195 [Nocardiaceae bacterium]|nr:hypothetical protein [Nocardiaceae bacterium]